jgi:hypothetical protein
MNSNPAFGKKTKMYNADILEMDETVSMQDKIEDETAAFLQRLESEEDNLMKNKQNLLSLREKLRSKLEKKVEGKKIGNKKLRAEIADLKIDCERLSISLWVNRHLQNLELTSEENFRQTLKNKGYSEKAINQIWKWYDYSGNNPESN